jgi:hypothetical protein
MQKDAHFEKEESIYAVSRPGLRKLAWKTSWNSELASKLLRFENELRKLCAPAKKCTTFVWTSCSTAIRTCNTCVSVLYINASVGSSRSCRSGSCHNFPFWVRARAVGIWSFRSHAVGISRWTFSLISSVVFRFTNFDPRIVVSSWCLSKLC